MKSEMILIKKINKITINIHICIATHRFCGIIGLRVISSLVVDQHLDQLVVHDLHVHLQPANDDDADNGGDHSLTQEWIC